MMKTGFVFLAFIWSSFSFAVAEVDVSKTVEICKDESRPILFYSDLFSAPNDSNELYLDRFKGQL